jgi:hypothetical protein
MMPPQGGIIVSGAGFSTALMNRVHAILWTSGKTAFADRHLARLAETLRNGALSFPQRLWTPSG